MATAVVAATVAGVVIGSAIGHDASSRRGRTERVVTESRPYDAERCEVRYDKRVEERIDGYRVTYEYNGIRQTAQLPYDPGDRIRRAGRRPSRKAEGTFASATSRTMRAGNILPASFYSHGGDSDRLRSDRRTPRHTSSLLMLFALAACSAQAGDHDETTRPADDRRIVLAESGMSLDQAVSMVEKRFKAWSCAPRRARKATARSTCCGSSTMQGASGRSG